VITIAISSREAGDSSCLPLGQPEWMRVSYFPAARGTAQQERAALSNIEHTLASTKVDQTEATALQRIPAPLGKRSLLAISWLAPATVVIVWELLATMEETDGQSRLPSRQ
jgi:hypothetical protein